MKINNFRKYYDLRKRYKDIFNTVFENYYKKGYFGSVSKDEIKFIQYEWFCKLVQTVENKNDIKLKDILINHNNKITRDYYSKITGLNLCRKKKDDIIEILNDKRYNNVRKKS